MSQTVWIILAGALLTYLTRIGGHVVLSRFQRVHPRIDFRPDVTTNAEIRIEEIHFTKK